MYSYVFLRNPMDSYLSPWIPMDPYGFLWIPMGSYVFLWIPMDSFGFLRIPLDSYRNEMDFYRTCSSAIPHNSRIISTWCSSPPSGPMDSYGFLWVPLGHGFVWNTLEPYEILWSPMESYGILWNRKGYFVFLWILMDSQDFSLFLWTPIGFLCVTPIDDSLGSRYSYRISMNSYASLWISLYSYVFLCVPLVS